MVRRGGWEKGGGVSSTRRSSDADVVAVVGLVAEVAPVLARHLEDLLALEPVGDAEGPHARPPPSHNAACEGLLATISSNPSGPVPSALPNPAASFLLADVGYVQTIPRTSVPLHFPLFKHYRPDSIPIFTQDLLAIFNGQWLQLPCLHMHDMEQFGAATVRGVGLCKFQVGRSLLLAPKTGKMNC